MKIEELQILNLVRKVFACLERSKSVVLCSLAMLRLEGGDTVLQMLELAQAVRTIYETGIEFEPECFVELAGEKLEAYLRNVGPLDGRLFEIIAIEPTVIERVGDEKIIWEISIVTESERDSLLKAVKFVCRASGPMTGSNISFRDRLDWLRPRLPGVIVGDDTR